MTSSHPESRHPIIASPGLVLDLAPKRWAPRMTDCHPESRHLNAPPSLPLNHPALRKLQVTEFAILTSSHVGVSQVL